jgi:TonB-linked SusC/RagA family outer membrane protein
MKNKTKLCQTTCLFSNVQWLIKLVVTLLFLVVFSNTSFSQSQKFSFDKKTSSIVDVFKYIDEKSNYNFLYESDDIINVERKDIKFSQLSINEVLELILKNTDLQYKIVDKYITISFLNHNKQNEKAITISGIVTDVKQETLPGVSIMIPGSSTGTVTDIDGRYELSIPASTTSLLFSYIGMQDTKISIGDKTTINIEMTEDAIGLDEVVVVGYGTQKKANLTGSVASVDIETMSTKTATNVSTALQGSLPGVTITQSSGQPGNDGGTIRIRGVSSFSNNGPLVIIDGIVGELDIIDPNDIKSISVLKDAASTSIYGTRGGNGVILVTTKKGKRNEEVTVSYNTYLAWQTPTNLIEMLDSEGLAKVVNQQNLNDGKPLTYSPEDIKKYADGSDPDNYANTDWLDELFQGSGFMQNHHLSLKGGSEKSNYMLSISYRTQEGIIENTFNDRYGMRFNLNSNPYERLETGITFNYTRTDFKEPSNPFSGNNFYQVIRQAYKLHPTIVNKYSNGTYGYGSDGNPIAWLEQGSNSKKIINKITGKLFANLRLIDNLFLNTSFGIRSNNIDASNFTKDITYYNPTSGDISKYQGPNSLKNELKRSYTVNTRAILNYNKEIASNHEIGFLAGIERDDYRYDYDNLYRKDFPVNTLSEIDVAPEAGQTMEGYAKEAVLLSYLGRINYAYKHKYLFEANIRRDGSSRFTDGNRWGTYPSFSAGWRVSEEPFLKSLKLLRNFKIRGSWGQTGNFGAGYYDGYNTLITTNGYPFDDAMSAGIGNNPTAGNESLTWETLTMSNIGVDANINLNNYGSIELTTDIFKKLTEDILLDVPVSATFGLDAPKQNSASVENKGLELDIKYRNSFGDLKLDLGLNVAFISQEITELSDGKTQEINGDYIKRVGESINSFYGYKCIGYFKDDADVANSAHRKSYEQIGDLKYADLNGPDGKPDGKIDNYDKVILGDRMPETTYGISASLDYKGFDFSMLLQGATDYQMMESGQVRPNLESTNGLKRLLDSWTPENTDASSPRLASSRLNTTTSSYWVQDVTYLRLKNIQIGYTLPKNIIKVLKIRNVRLYLSGQNLATFTNLDYGFDPEGNGGYGTYPQVKIYSVGLNVNF